MSEKPGEKPPGPVSSRPGFGRPVLLLSHAAKKKTTLPLFDAREVTKALGVFLPRLRSSLLKRLFLFGQLHCQDTTQRQREDGAGDAETGHDTGTSTHDQKAGIGGRTNLRRRLRPPLPP